MGVSGIGDTPHQQQHTNKQTAEAADAIEIMMTSLWICIAMSDNTQHFGISHHHCEYFTFSPFHFRNCEQKHSNRIISISFDMQMDDVVCTVMSHSLFLSLRSLARSVWKPLYVNYAFGSRISLARNLPNGRWMSSEHAKRCGVNSTVDIACETHTEHIYDKTPI